MAGRGAKGAGKKAAKTYERPGLSEEEIEEIKEAFNLFDTDGSGTCLSRGAPACVDWLAWCAVVSALLGHCCHARIGWCAFVFFFLVQFCHMY